MDWNSLKTLTYVSQNGSITSAAKALGVNYTTVLRRIESLEKEIGGKLFERGSKGYKPTPLAEEVLALAFSMQESAEKIERHIVGKEFLPKGIVKITAPFNITNHYLPPVLASITRDYPDIRYEILSSNDLYNLNSRVADIAIRATSSPPEHLIGRKAATIPWGMFVSKQFESSYSALPTLETLADFPLIGGMGNMLNLPAFSWLEAHFARSIVMRCDELTAMSYYAQSGHGIAFLPVDQRREGLLEVAKFEPGETSDLWILTHPDLRKSERVRIVSQYLVNYFKAINFETPSSPK
ncbi:putative Bacterial regulatory protein, LysR [Vibrio nigripulchritudo SO65]|uniref:LysR family transcriptional regulator n=1 Tax=Vibrio nigripulchritudo TaxID=28173 RepID=UPI0003B2205F|nr:LysR family transcriptional regulator [Vibrio nigripulchritudo]CCN35078.1 putative Bacterial regulatory protein, LysR [Vibrio nigripulchritudo AM115]CCN40767.1 putative Bacterial regulatory protein, LysR [Vibrio nigripulchritudo FTn2]CCN64424.1 putative Bacterial regulatory protein, LysR [Vibrio nigripulchritudo POn4]CCN77467.1 putative Bacterial regulatory protein, LysR [Vibrio nigripulchritudo SO65]